MAKLLSGMIVALALSSFGLAQGAAAQTSQTSNAAQAASPAASQAATPRIAPGSVIPVQLTTTVDSKKAKSGEQVTAKVTQDLKSSNGMMLMPKDTEIVGHITEAQPRNKQDKESQVGIVFDHAMVNNSNVSYPLSIQAVISQQIFQNPNQNANNGNAGAPQQAPSSSMPSSAPGQAPGASGRGMGGEQPAPASPPPADNGSGTSSASNPRPEITGHTQGMVGFSHMKLETPANATQPSVIRSEKNNVKLENGTLMLLRVNQ
jgi:hypothetical protein